MLGYSSCLVVWHPLFLDPSDGVFGRFDLAALCGCRTFNFCLFVCCLFLSILRVALKQPTSFVNCVACRPCSQSRHGRFLLQILATAALVNLLISATIRLIGQSLDEKPALHLLCGSNVMSESSV